MSTRVQAGALTPLVVLDCSESIAGQFCCRMLADYGADVLLVEPPAGSMTRTLPPFGDTGDGAPQSLAFFHNNVGKRSIALDTSTAHGRAELAGLAAAADVIVVPAGADRAGPRVANPDLIICTVSDFGEGTPKSHWRGSEIIYQAMSGMMNNNGTGDHKPLYGVGRRASASAGIAAYIAILTALIERRRSGIAQDVAIDIAETAASMCFPFALQHSYNGSLETRGDRGQPLIELKCREAWISIWIRAGHFPIICEVLGAPELIADPRFATDNLRLDHFAELVAELQALVADRYGRELVTALGARRLVAACAYLPSQLGPDAPHLAERDYWTRTDDPAQPPVLGPQFRLSVTPRGPVGAAPALGTPS